MTRLEIPVDLRLTLKKGLGGIENMLGGGGKELTGGGIARSVITLDRIARGIERLVKIGIDSSMVLTGTLDIMKKSFQMALRPIADIVGYALLPLALEMLRLTVPISNWFNNLEKGPESTDKSVAKLMSIGGLAGLGAIGGSMIGSPLGGAAAGAGIGAVLTGILEDLGIKSGELWGLMEGKWNIFMEGFSSELDKFKTSLRSKLDTIISGFTDWVFQIQDKFNNFKINLGNMLANIINSISAWLESKLSKVGINVSLPPIATDTGPTRRTEPVISGADTYRLDKNGMVVGDPTIQGVVASLIARQKLTVNVNVEDTTRNTVSQSVGGW